MSGSQLMHDAVSKLCIGWNESVEYSVLMGADVELRVRSRHFEGLLDQLTTLSRMPSSMTGGHNPNKSGSKPPVNQAPLNLIDDIYDEAIKMREVLADQPPKRRKPPLRRILRELVTTCAAIEPTRPELVRTSVRTAETWVRRSRIMLGYDARETTLTDTVCGQCGGGLAVAVDASTDVRCIGAPDAAPCGMRYPRWTWLALL